MKKPEPLKIDPRELYRKGYLSASYFHHKEIADKVSQLIRAGFTKPQAIQKMVKDYGLARTHVYKILRRQGIS